MTFYFRKYYLLLPVLMLLTCMMATTITYGNNRPDFTPETNEKGALEGDVIDSLKNLLANQQNDTLKARIFSQLASKLRHSSTTEALSYGIEALKISQHLSEQDKARDQQILGLIYSSRSDFKHALFYTLQALRTYESLNEKQGITYAYNAIGIIYERLKKYDLSERYYLQALGMIKALKLQQNLSMIYCNLGNIMADQQQMNKCIYYYKKAIEYAPLSDNKGTTSSMLYNLGEYYSNLNMRDSAKTYYTRALLEKKDRAVSFIDANAYYAIGRIEMEQQHFNDANTNLLSAKRMAQEGSLTDLLINVYQTLADLRKKEKKFDEAFDYFTLYASLKDSIYNETSITQINEVQKAYELEKRDKEIQLLNKDKEIAETRTRTTRNLYILFFSFVICIGLVLIRNLILRQRVQHRMLNEKNALIENDLIKMLSENTEARFEVLKSKTSPHFLFNSLASLSAIVKDNQTASEFLEQFIDLYRRVLETNTQKLTTLKEEMSVVNNYLYLEKVRFEDNINIDIDISDQALRLQIPPFALQIILENAFKHNIITDKKRLNVRIFDDGDFVTVINNLQKKSSVSESTRIGQKNIIERYQLLTDKQPTFEETEQEYIVKLPLLEMQKSDLMV